MSKRKLEIYMPTDEEDAAITAAAMTDPDNPPATDAMLAKMKPARPRGRPALAEDERKTRTALRVDTTVLKAYRSTGKGYQTLMGRALAEYAEAHGLIKH
jgi:uncharacterized protein (DUF4415 family)